MSLMYGFVYVLLRLPVLVEYRRTDSQTDRRTRAHIIYRASISSHGNDKYILQRAAMLALQALY